MTNTIRALQSADVYTFDINQPFVTQEQKFKYWEESKAEIKRLKAAIAYMQEQSEAVAYLCRSKMTDYAISLLPTKVARERESAKGWSDWHPVEVEKYKFYLNSIGKSDWLSCYEFIPLFTTPQRQQPLKRLDKSISRRLWVQCEGEAECFANAIMDEMERINK